ncbi:hypothetical protein [Gordonia phthalatica]|uniref:hypothetical protein n=1 Tax=Gordonia phthalatica TaxID=1136941 RepID=UPI000780BB63|nr:hypothetical protein [Gordonia phthalatica]
MIGVRTRYALGMIVATTLLYCFGDHFFHVRMGMLRYNWAPLVDGQSVWVYLFFLGGSIIIWFLGIAFARLWTDTEATVPSWRYIGGTFVALIAVYLCSGLIGVEHPHLYFWIMLVTFALRLVIEERTHRAGMLAAAVVIAVGAFIEGGVAWLGLFTYAHVDVAEIPAWLVAAYLHIAFFAVAVARRARFRHAQEQVGVPAAELTPSA